MADDYGPPEWSRDGETYPAVYSHVTHSRLGEHFPEGERMAVMFHDRAVLAEVVEVVDTIFYRCQSCSEETVRRGQHDRPDCPDCDVPMAKVEA